MTRFYDGLNLALSVLVVLGMFASTRAPLMIRYLVDACLVFWIAVAAIIAAATGFGSGAIGYAVLAGVWSLVTVSDWRARQHVIEVIRGEHPS